MSGEGGAPEARVLLLGAMGRMGERVRAALEDAPGMALGAAVEAPGHPAQGSRLEGGVVLGDDAKAALPGCDVAIAFATPEPTLALLREAAGSGTPCAVGTTGWSEAQSAEIRELAGRAPILLAANFSVAVNVLAHLVRRAAALLGEGWDAEILELHHGRKVDAPSGTALALARAVAEGRGVAEGGERLVLAREGHTGARPEGVVGIQALRGGDVAGEHTVHLLGAGERIELAHRAATRDHFARGAVRAAAWLLGRPPRLYGMDEVLGLS